MFYDLALGLSWKMSHMHLIRKVHSAAIGLSSWLIDLFSFQHFKYVIPLLSFFFFFSEKPAVFNHIVILCTLGFIVFC